VYCAGVVHLSGYVMPEDEFPGPTDAMTDSEEKEEQEQEELESEEDTPPPCISCHC